MCLTLRRSVSMLVPLLLGLNMFVYYCDPNQQFCKALNLHSRLELKMAVLVPTSLPPMIRDMSRPTLLYFGPPNPISKPAFSNVWHMGYNLFWFYVTFDECEVCSYVMILFVPKQHLICTHGICFMTFTKGNHRNMLPISLTFGIHDHVLGVTR